MEISQDRVTAILTHGCPFDVEVQASIQHKLLTPTLVLMVLLHHGHSSHLVDVLGAKD